MLGGLRRAHGKLERGRCIAFEVGEDIVEGEVSGVYIVCLLYMLSLGIIFLWENTSLNENGHRLDLYESAATWLGLLPQPRLHVPAYRQVWRP